MTEPSGEISLLVAAILGVVEGLTEFLPVSSTGHLIISAQVLGLDLENSGIQAFLIVIQAGALLAVIGRYRKHIALMFRGVTQADPEGRRLIVLLSAAFAPVVVIAPFLASTIKGWLFSPYPVGLALAIGGIAMILVERSREKRQEVQDFVEGKTDLSFLKLTWRTALIIGLAQCLAMWPGTSRSMVTLVAGIAVGLSARTAAEFSFLLALPTLGAATAHDLLKDGGALMDAAGPAGLFIGFAISCVVAAVAMDRFIHYLGSHRLSVFGWYRVAIAFVILLLWTPT